MNRCIIHYSQVDSDDAFKIATADKVEKIRHFSAIWSALDKQPENSIAVRLSQHTTTATDGYHERCYTYFCSQSKYDRAKSQKRKVNNLHYYCHYHMLVVQLVLQYSSLIPKVHVHYNTTGNLFTKDLHGAFYLH